MSDFTIRPFAFMRLTHDAMRDGFAALQAAADNGDFDAANVAWRGLKIVIDLHKRHEEEVFFPMLDERFDEAVSRAGLRDTHTHEVDHEEAVEAALGARNLEALTAALTTWAPAFEAHLKDEEDVMMPLTQRVAPTPEGRAAEVRRILEMDWETLEAHQVPYVVRCLANRPYGQLRTFVSALQVSAGDRYHELEPGIRAALPAGAIEQLTLHGHLTP